MNFVVLKTDALFFVLLAVALTYTVYARNREHLRAPWRQVSRQPIGMSAAVILASFVLIALLDSIHFHPELPTQKGVDSEVRYSSEIASLFDLVVEPLKLNVEKTYSAPFATHAFAKETIELPDGGTVRDYPRLTHGGAHLDDPATGRADDLIRARRHGRVAGARELARRCRRSNRVNRTKCKRELAHESRKCARSTDARAVVRDTRNVGSSGRCDWLLCRGCSVLSHPRYRQSGQRCPLSSTQEHSHGALDWNFDDARHVAVCDPVGHYGGIFSRLDR